MEMVFEKREMKDVLGRSNQPKVMLVQKVENGPKLDGVGLTIEATASGVRVYGTMAGAIETREELTQFATAVASIFMTHQELKQQLRRRLMGVK